jgi:hypothetical protein
MARQWMYNFARGQRFPTSSAEDTYQRQVAQRWLLWDLTLALVSFACVVLNSQLVLEGIALGCDQTSSGRVWSPMYTNQTLEASNIHRAASSQTAASCTRSAGSDRDTEQQCAASGANTPYTAYPCSDMWPHRLIYAARNWRELSTAVVSNPVAWQVLWSLLLPSVTISAALLLACSVAGLCVLRNRRRQHIGVAQHDASIAVHQPAQLVPGWWLRVRHAALVLPPQLSATVSLIASLLAPLPPHLLPWTRAYTCSSAGHAMCAESTAIRSVATMVSGLAMAPVQHQPLVS